jgi:hypothetical protein
MPLRLALRTIVAVEKVKRRRKRSLPELSRMADRLGLGPEKPQRP